MFGRKYVFPEGKFPEAVSVSIPAKMPVGVALGCECFGREGDQRVEVVHKSVLSPEHVRASMGTGEWFWRWTSLPDRPGVLYAFASPRAAAEDALYQLFKWSEHVRKKITDPPAWATWRKPGD